MKDVYVMLLATVFVGLVGAIYAMILSRFNKIDERLRSLGHEDRSIRSEIADLVSTLIQTSGEERKQMSRSLDVMAKVFSRYGAISRDRLEEDD